MNLIALEIQLTTICADLEPKYGYYFNETATFLGKRKIPTVKSIFFLVQFALMYCIVKNVVPKI